MNPFINPNFTSRTGNISSGVYLLVFILMYSVKISAQKPFQGSFLMSFKIAENNKDYPMVWHIEDKLSGGKIAMEVQDEMISKGVSRRILYNQSDSTWTMLIEFNAVKQGTRIGVKNLYTDTSMHKNISIRKTKEVKNIEGYACSKFIAESKDYTADMWITKQINFDLVHLYKLLAHCGMLSNHVKKGEWYKSKNFKGMVMKVTSTKKSTGENYTMEIKNIIPGKLNETFFDLKGFRISNIPEGQSCGVAIEDE
jgi:hypothetical protein